jgi:hypothetical protein
LTFLVFEETAVLAYRESPRRFLPHQVSVGDLTLIGLKLAGGAE